MLHPVRRALRRSDNRSVFFIMSLFLSGFCFTDAKIYFLSGNYPPLVVFFSTRRLWLRKIEEIVSNYYDECADCVSEPVVVS